MKSRGKAVGDVGRKKLYRQQRLVGFPDLTSFGRASWVGKPVDPEKLEDKSRETKISLVVRFGANTMR